MGRTDKLSAHGPLSVFDEALNSFENIIIRRFNVWRLFSSVMPAVFSKPRDAPHALAAATFNTFTGVCVWCAHIPHYMKWHKTRNYRENFGSFAMANPFRAKTFILCVFLFLIFFVFTLKTVCRWVAFNFAWWVFFVCSQRSLSTWCRWRYRSRIYFDGGIVLLLVGSFVRWPSARMECNY